MELSFLNANLNLTPEGVLLQPGYHHFYRGIDSSKWKNGVPHYKELLYPAVWEGVDLELSGSQDGLKMNWDRKPVNCVYRLYGSFDLGFELTGSYLENTPLIIDPILTYATYLGGSLTEDARGIAVDTQGYAYATGYTTSVDFPVTPGKATPFLGLSGST